MTLKRLCMLLLAIVLMLGLCACGMSTEKKYNQAIADVKAGKYDTAIVAFEALNDYGDSAKYIAYARALQAGDGGDYEAAIKALEELNGFEKSAVYLTSYTTLAYEAEQTQMKSVYNQAIADVKAGKYDEAIAAFEALNDYEDSGKYIMYARCLQAGDGGEYETAINSLTALGDFKEAGMYIKYYTALSYEAEQEYEEAAKIYNGILLFKDVEFRKAALPDKILDRDLTEAEREFEEEEDWDALSEMVGKKYTTSETQMYENIMAFAAELHEKQEYGMAAEVYLLVREDGYEKADAGFKESAYQYVQELMADGAYSSVRSLISDYLFGYKDADELSKECSYQLALEKEASGAQSAQAAYSAFKALNTYKDSADHAAAYETKYAEAASKREGNEFDAAITLFTELGTYSDSSDRLAEARNAKAYAAAVSLMDSEKYEEAIEAFKTPKGYSDSAAQIEACEAAILEREYQKAVGLKDAQAAYDAFKALGDYKDSVDRVVAYETKYAEAVSKREFGEFDAALALFAELGSYSDSSDRLAEAKNAKAYAEAVSKREFGEFDAAIALFAELGTYSDSSDRLAEAQNAKAYAAAVSLMDSEKYEEAIEAFKALNGYSDSAAQIEACEAAILEREYQKAVSLKNDEKYEEAIEAFKALKGYSDSAAQIEAAISEREYQKAEKLRESGEYAEAYAIYLTIRGYKDVDEIITNDAGIAKVAAYQPGNYVTFGTYPQTKSGTDDTPIEWLVLESDGETAMLISRYALDCQMYNTTYTSTTWEKCTLRSWLNKTFYNRTFSETEKQSILTSDVSADKNPHYSTNPGNATKDNVFLLSIVEANKYFTNDTARMCAPTDYAIQQGAYTSSKYTVDGRGACWWWLRSPGYDSKYAADVGSDGSIYNYGNYVDFGDIAVRPCVRVRLF